MNKYFFVLACLLLLPLASRAQFFGLAGQYSKNADGQFIASISVPTIHPKNPLNCFISSGIDYTTSGGASMAGLWLKPIQISWFGTEKFFNRTPFTLLAQLDAGYLLDFRKKRPDGFTLSPALYLDYKYFFVKSGIDFDLSHNRQAFFVRAGVSIGLGTLKSFLDTQIW